MCVQRPRAVRNRVLRAAHRNKKKMQVVVESNQEVFLKKKITRSPRDQPAAAYPRRCRETGLQPRQCKMSPTGRLTRQRWCYRPHSSCPRYRRMAQRTSRLCTGGHPRRCRTPPRRRACRSRRCSARGTTCRPCRTGPAPSCHQRSNYRKDMRRLHAGRGAVTLPPQGHQRHDAHERVHGATHQQSSQMPRDRKIQGRTSTRPQQRRPLRNRTQAGNRRRWHSRNPSHTTCPAAQRR